MDEKRQNKKQTTNGAGRFQYVELLVHICTEYEDGMTTR